ncbi:MAG: polysaccharide biosynthesis/export family protein [Planctomycetota bacterium]|nr:polysaccharide biosynthesis/export family protein [Planctomycetota bacterium]
MRNSMTLAALLGLSLAITGCRSTGFLPIRNASTSGGAALPETLTSTSTPRQAAGRNSGVQLASHSDGETESGECSAGRCGPGGCGRDGCGPQCDYDAPRELKKISLPDYVVEPPDILLIEATNSLRPASAPLRSGEALNVQVANTLPLDELDDEVRRNFKQINGTFTVQPDGMIYFGPEYGSVPVRGLTVAEAGRSIELHLRNILKAPQVYVRIASDQARQHISGEHLVRPDGTVALGVYGSVYVSGLSLNSARQAIERHLTKSLHNPEVTVDVLAYNSKAYYIVTDGGGAGEQVFRFPCTGNETVLDALSQINGLPVVASKKDNDMITFDNGLAKLIAPLERIAGFVLLGNGTVRAVQFGHRGQQGGSNF